jgi:hypothetical protein
MAKPKQDLRLAAARYALGELATAEIVRIADALLEEGVYSQAIGELATTPRLDMADAGPLFEDVLRELEVEVPSREKAIWGLLRHHIGRIACQDVAPREGLQAVLHVYNLTDRQPQAETYVVESHGIERLIGAYWEYSDLVVRPAGESLEPHPEELAALDDIVVRAANEWVDEHGA